MQADLEVRLVHDGINWIATHPDFKASGATLAELDHNLIQCLQTQQRYPDRRSVMVFMVFDHSCIPVWIRQYAYHYFNRYIRLDLNTHISENTIKTKE